MTNTEGITYRGETYLPGEICEGGRESASELPTERIVK